MRQKGNSPIIVIALILIIISVMLVLAQSFKTDQELLSTTPQPAITIEPFPAPTDSVTKQTAKITTPSNWKKYTEPIFDTDLEISLHLPDEYEFLNILSADKAIVKKIPHNVEVNQNTQFESLYLGHGPLVTYDNGSRRDFYRRYLNGEIDEWNQGGEGLEILSVKELPLNGSSYIEFVTTYNNGNPNTIHYVTVVDGYMVVFSGEQNKNSYLQQNIEKVLNSLEVTKN